MTPIFNKAARGPNHVPVKTYKQKIADLRALLSQPKPEQHLTPKYSGANPPRPSRDKEITKHIDAIRDTVAKQREKIKRDFAKAAIRGTAKRSFNRASRGM
ncbi:hypothetical protein [Planctomycetes bacterium TBK1r]|uniref:hypothetical protein n=1 Tax=Stieleria magnilauensis TaxID=2527963 RepID=UPI00119EF33C